MRRKWFFVNERGSGNSRVSAGNNSGDTPQDVFKNMRDKWRPDRAGNWPTVYICLGGVWYTHLGGCVPEDGPIIRQKWCDAVYERHHIT